MCEAAAAAIQFIIITKIFAAVHSILDDCSAHVGGAWIHCKRAGPRSWGILLGHGGGHHMPKLLYPFVLHRYNGRVFLMQTRQTERKEQGKKVGCVMRFKQTLGV